MGLELKHHGVNDMKNYEAKREWLCNKYNFQCVIAKSHKKQMPVTELHHSHIHNKKWVRKLYPLFIDSIWNLLPVNNAYHLAYGNFGRWPEERVSRCENFLKRHKKLAEWVNDPDIYGIIQGE